MNRLEEIRACPMCGSTASVRVDDELQHSPEKPNLLVACDNPDCQIYKKRLHDTWEDAIADWNNQPRLEQLEKQLAAAPCWCNDCVFGRNYEEHGIGCFNTDSEYNGEWVGTYDSCEQCRRRGPKES